MLGRLSIKRWMAGCREWEIVEVEVGEWERARGGEEEKTTETTAVRWTRMRQIQFLNDNEYDGNDS
jgi:hypothetical protein